MKKRYKFLLYMLAILGCNLAFAQQRAIIRGRVIDKVEKVPVIGANVIEYDRDNRIINGTVCDINGDFTLEGRHLRDEGVVHRLLDGRRAEHRPAGVAHRHNVGVVSEDGEGM